MFNFQVSQHCDNDHTAIYSLRLILCNTKVGTHQSCQATAHKLYYATGNKPYITELNDIKTLSTSIWNRGVYYKNYYIFLYNHELC